MDEAINDPELLAELAALNVSGSDEGLGDPVVDSHYEFNQSPEPLMDSVKSSLIAVDSLLSDQPFEDNDDEGFDFERELSQLVQTEKSASSAPSLVTAEMVNMMKQEMFALNDQGKVKEAGAMRKKVKELEEAQSQPSPVSRTALPPLAPAAAAQRDTQAVNPLKQQTEELRVEAMRALKTGDKARAMRFLKEAKVLEAKLPDESPSSPVVTMIANNVNNVHVVIAAKRTEAVDHHKAGRVTEARAAMAEAKRLESQLGADKRVSGSEIRGCLPEVRGDLWDDLQHALEEVIAEHESMDAGAGATWKLVSPDLAHLRKLEVEVAKRRKLKCNPPLFQLERIIIEREAVVQALRSDELVVVVTGLEDMVDDEKSRIGVTLSMDTSLLADETSPPLSNGNSNTVIDGRCSIEHTATFTIKRSPKHARRFEKRGLDVTLVRKTKSFFGRVTQEVLAEGKFKMAPMINKCVHAEVMTLHLPGQPRKIRRGHVLLELRLHHPIGVDGAGRDMRRVPMTNITLGPWGDGSVQIQRESPFTAPSAAALTTSNRKSSKVVAAKPSCDEVDMVKVNKDFAELSVQERKDPLSAQHLVSEAVINHLLASATEPMVKMTLQNQLLLLQVNFDNGNMTPDIYLKNLTARISRDVFLAKFLIASKRRSEAVKVMERTKIMKQEIADLKAMLAKIT